MRISKQSWHFKAWRFLHPFSLPSNLCAYMSGLAFVGLVALLGVAVVVMLALCFGLMEVDMATYGWRGSVLFNTGVAVFALAFWQRVRICSFIYGLLASNKPKQPSLIGTWLAAKKAQVCPLVEFVDEEV